MPLIPFLLTITAAVLHALWNFAAKKASGNLGIIWTGLLIATMMLFPFLFLLSPEEIFAREALPFVVATGVIHALYFFSLAKAYEYGDISVVYPIARGSAIATTAIAAHLLLQENMSATGAVGILLISIGVLLLGFKNIRQRRGIFFSIATAALIAGYSINDKLGVGILHPVAYIFWLASLTTIFLFPYIIIKRKADFSRAFDKMKKYALIIGPGSIATYLIILFVFQMTQVSYVVAVRESAVAIGALLGMVFLKEEISRQKIFSIAVIVIGMFLIRIA